MTTGALPTFIDVGSSFGSSNITVGLATLAQVCHSF